MLKIRSLVLPLKKSLLLLPRTAVAEVLPKLAIDTQQTELSWRNLTIPFINFETLSGLSEQIPVSASAVVVINSISGDFRLPFYAMPIFGGMPSIQVMVDEDLRTFDIERNSFIDRAVIWQDKICYIPNLQAIEDYLKNQR